MNIGWLRDLFIIIFSIVFTIATIFITVLVFSIYAKTRNALDVMKITAQTVEDISQTIKNEVVQNRPLVQAIAIMQGVRQGVEIFNNLFKKH